MPKFHEYSHNRKVLELDGREWHFLMLAMEFCEGIDSFDGEQVTALWYGISKAANEFEGSLAAARRIATEFRDNLAAHNPDAPHIPLPWELPVHPMNPAKEGGC